MKRRGRRNPLQWIDNIRSDLRHVSADSGDGADKVQAKIQKAQTLVEKLENIQRDMWERECLMNQLHYLSQDDMYIKAVEQRMEERFYEHHGRVIEKHISIREQDTTIRALRQKMVHQINNLAGEKRLINDLRLADETRSAIISICNGMENTNCSYKEDKEYIEAWRARAIQDRTKLKKMRARLYKLDKELNSFSGETMLKKIKELKEEVVSFISKLNRKYKTPIPRSKNISE